MRKDYIAQWYEVREEQGVSDRIHLFLHDAQNRLTEWHHFRHRDTDGMGMIAAIKDKLGYTHTPLPHCRDTREPGFWRTLRSVRCLPRNHAAKKVQWAEVYSPAEATSAEINPDWRLLNAAELQQLKNTAQQRGVSVASLTLACLNRAVFSTCLQPGSHAWWFYPVNVRGAVQGAEQSNLSSGFYLLLDANSSAEAIHAQVKQKLAAREHWWLWKMAHIGRWIGKGGVRFIYQRLSRSQFYLGSFSYLGDWSLPDHPHLLLGVCGAGSANYPIATGVTECNGQLTLALKFHPSVPAAEQAMHKCLQCWQQLLRETAQHA